MEYRTHLAPEAGRQIASLPASVRHALIQKLAEIVRDPYDLAHSDPLETQDHRRAVFADIGLVQFQVWSELAVVIVRRVLWAG